MIIEVYVLMKNYIFNSFLCLLYINYWTKRRVYERLNVYKGD